MLWLILGVLLNIVLVSMTDANASTNSNINKACILNEDSTTKKSQLGFAVNSQVKVSDPRTSVPSLKDIPKGSRIHIAGIAGKLMVRIAQALVEAGYDVTGSDPKEIFGDAKRQLEEMGIDVMPSQNDNTLDPKTSVPGGKPQKPALVVIGNVMGPGYTEIKELLKRYNTDQPIPFISSIELIADYFIADKNSIGVAGSHGKTTTSALMAYITSRLELSPGYFIGGDPLNLESGFRVSKDGQWHVIEADEYDDIFWQKLAKFLSYKLKYTILTSIDHDHFDLYPTEEDYRLAFRRLLQQKPEDSLIVAYAENKGVQEVLKGYQKPFVTYGMTSGDYQPHNIQRLDDGTTKFDVYKHNKKIKSLHLKRMMGLDYNILNALSAFALTYELSQQNGWSPNTIVEAINDFAGTKRRQELIGEVNDIRIYDDFAHHEVAFKNTIQGFKTIFPKRTVWAVVEPRSNTTITRAAEEQLIRALDGADKVIIGKTGDQSKLAEEYRLRPDVVAQQLTAHGTTTLAIPNADDIATHLAENAQQGDIIVIMSNGGFDGLHQKALEKLKIKYQ